MAAAKKSVPVELPTSGWNTRTIINTASSFGTLLLVLFGGISVWTTVVSNQNVTAEALRNQADSIKEVKTQLQFIQNAVSQVQIGLAGKQDRHP